MGQQHRRKVGVNWQTCPTVMVMVHLQGLVKTVAKLEGHAAKLQQLQHVLRAVGRLLLALPLKVVFHAVLTSYLAMRFNQGLCLLEVALPLQDHYEGADGPLMLSVDLGNMLRKPVLRSQAQRRCHHSRRLHEELQTALARALQPDIHQK